jgi:hypothetical protein
MATIVAVTSLEICDCSGCGAQAYWRFDLNEHSLTFCGHHSGEHMRILQTQGFVPSLLVLSRHPAGTAMSGK